MDVESIGSPDEGSKSSSSSMLSISGIVEEFEPIKQSIQKIHNACNQIDLLYISETADLQKVNEIISQTNQTIVNAKDILEQSKKEHLSSKSNKQDEDILLFENIFKFMLQSFKTVIKQYKECSNRCKDAIKEDLRRRASIIHPEISEEQMRAMIDSRDPDSMINGTGRLELLEPAKLERIKHIEHQIEEIDTLFSACALLVIESAEIFEEIEIHMEETHEKVVDGKEKIDDAKDYGCAIRQNKIKVVAAAFAFMSMIVLAILTLKHRTNLL